MTIIEWLLLGGLVISSFMAGLNLNRKRHDEIIEDTIDALVSQRYIRSKTVDGEEVLLKIHEEY